MKKRFFFQISILAIGVISFYSCSTDSKKDQAAKTENLLLNFDGKTLFKGILFADGPVASMIPENRDIYDFKREFFSTEELEEYSNAIEE